MSRFYAIANRSRKGNYLRPLTRRGHPNGLTAELFTRWGTLKLAARTTGGDFDLFGAFLNGEPIAAFTEDTTNETGPDFETTGNDTYNGAPRFVITDHSRPRHQTDAPAYASDETDGNGDYTDLTVRGWNAGIYARLHRINADGSAEIRLYRDSGSGYGLNGETFLGYLIIGPETRWNPVRPAIAA